jgi:aspartate carbamoyltransferase regulatory subunit
LRSELVISISEDIVQIRKMLLSDYHNVYKLWLNSPGIGLNTVDDSEMGIEKYLLRNPNTCFVAENDKWEYVSISDRMIR